MRKRKFIMLVVWVLVIPTVIVIGCMSDSNLSMSENERVSVKEVKDYFNLFVRKFSTSPDTLEAINNDYAILTPIWSKAKILNYNEIQIIEIPIDGPVTNFKLLSKTDKATLKNKYANTATKLIAYKDVNEIKFNIVKITAEDNYLLKKKRNITKFSLCSLSDFDGCIRYYDLNYRFIYGEKYKHGIVVGSISNLVKKQNNSLGCQTRSAIEDCYTTDYLVEEYYCWGYMDGEILITTGCDLINSWIETETICEWVEDPQMTCELCGAPGCLGECMQNIEDIVIDKEFISLINRVADRLKHKGIDVSNFKIEKSKSGCISKARISIDGKIILCPSFLAMKDIRDQSSIIYHEINHILKNHHLKVWEGLEKALNERITLTPPPHIEAYIRAEIDKEYPNESTQKEKDFAYDLDMSRANLLPPEYYMNEIEVYTIEIETMTDVSEEYALEREYLLWLNQELYEKALELYK